MLLALVPAARSPCGHCWVFEGALLAALVPRLARPAGIAGYQSRFWGVVEGLGLVCLRRVWVVFWKWCLGLIVTAFGLRACLRLLAQSIKPSDGFEPLSLVDLK